MKISSLIRLLAATLLLLGSAALFSGCSTSQEQESSQLPWARPASWEGGLPGGFGQQGRNNAF